MDKSPLRPALIISRKTCLDLYATSLAPSYFLSIARNLGQRLPLPTQRLTDLPADELKELCLKHQRSIINLSLPKPKVKQSKIIPIESDHLHTDVLYFAAIHGGHQCLILFGNGRLHLHNLRHEVIKDSDEEPDAFCGVVGENGIEVGEVLATYHFFSKPCEYDFLIAEDGNIVFAAILEPK